MTSKPIAEFAKGPNSFREQLKGEKDVSLDMQFDRRQVYRAHFTPVQPEKVKAPYLVASSSRCAESLGLDEDSILTQAFVDAFSGNKLPPGLDDPWASVYGCHCYGNWFGQLGDGRAMYVNRQGVHTSTGRLFSS